MPPGCKQFVQNGFVSLTQTHTIGKVVYDPNCGRQRLLALVYLALHLFLRNDLLLLLEDAVEHIFVHPSEDELLLGIVLTQMLFGPLTELHVAVVELGRPTYDD